MAAERSLGTGHRFDTNGCLDEWQSGAKLISDKTFGRISMRAWFSGPLAAVLIAAPVVAAGATSFAILLSSAERPDCRRGVRNRIRAGPVFPAGSGRGCAGAGGCD